MNYKQIRDDIVTQLKTYLNIPVVIEKQNIPKLEYPYISMKFLILKPKTRPLAIELNDKIPSTDIRFEYDIKRTRIEYPDITISVSSYSILIDEAEEFAIKACEWFTFFGRQYLSSKSYVLVETTSITERNIIISGNYEKRHNLIVDTFERNYGFDVTLRILNNLELVLPTIESVDIKSN